MPGEYILIYQRHLKSFIDEYNPEGATESHLVQALAETAWRLKRVAVLEANLLTAAAVGEVQDAMKVLAALESQSKALANLSLHSQRLSRQFESTLAQLHELQKTRHTREKRDIDNVLNIMEMYQSKEQTYVPSEDGFVFSQTQIDAAIRTRNRERRIAKASDFQYRRAA